MFEKLVMASTTVIDIKLDNVSKTFHPGDTIQGKVIISSKTTMKVSSEKKRFDFDHKIFLA